MNKKFILVTVFVILIIIIVYGLFISQNNKPNTYKIGAILSLTGRGAKYGKSAQQGIEVALKEINENGGVNGCELDILTEDSMSESKNAVSAYKKLVDIHKVNAVIGPILSDEVLAVAPEANRRQVLIITPGAGSDEISKAGPYVFRNRESATLQSAEIAKYLLKQPIPQRIAIVFSTTANAISYKCTVSAQLGQLVSRDFRRF